MLLHLFLKAQALRCIFEIKLGEPIQVELLPDLPHPLVHLLAQFQILSYVEERVTVLLLRFSILLILVDLLLLEGLLLLLHFLSLLFFLILDDRSTRM